jgi:peptidoglycan DL-endopeptidase CwlO
MLRRSYGPTRGASPVRRRRLTLVLAVGLAAGATFSGMAPAGAAPSGDLDSLTAQAQRIESQIQANNDRADVLDEQYLQAQSAAEAATRKIADAELGLARAERRAGRLHAQLGARAARLYMGAGTTDLFSFDVSNVRELGSRSKYGEAAAETDNRILDDLKLVEEQLGIQRKALEQQKSAAQDRQRAADSARQAIEGATRQQEQLLASVKGSIRAKVDEIARQRRAAEEAAARAEFARRQAAARSASAGNTPSAGNAVSVGNTVSSVDIGIDPGNIPAPNPDAEKAVAYARAQLGKPYQYAGTGPDSFDCSGLTMMAWAQAGVSMSHNAEAQYNEFPHVPVDQLQPGDLVFFGNPIHHVGLYVGGGTMIDAPQTGEFVHYSSVGRQDYAGAARP